MTNYLRNLTFLLILAMSFSVIAKTEDAKVVYGEDDRIEVYEADAMLADLAKGTAAQISHSALEELVGDLVKISGKSLSQRGICSDERFADQMTAARCSGFLVGEDLLVTAGHCIRTQSDCDNYSWVFDYKKQRLLTDSVIVKDSSVFRCKKIIEQSLDSYTKDDYALIRLDRSVEDRRPLEYRTEGKPLPGDPLVVIGHPTGLPTKIAAGAE
ncbi:MAG: trypsin-like serine peptidase, partial [Bacteriovoracia bacterium]